MLCEFIDQLHLGVDGDAEFRILVRWVNGAANVEVDVRRVLEQGAGKQ